jgi:hypothetical protein
MLKRLIQGTLLAAAMVLFASDAFAQVTINRVTLNGTGCRNGTVDVILQGSEASLTFNSYVVSTSQTRTNVTASCNVRIGLTVGSGLSVSVARLNWMGSASIERGVVNFARSFTVVGQGVVTATRQFTQSGFQTFNIVDEPRTVTISGCSQAQGILGANTTLNVQGRNNTAQVDTLDVAAFTQMLLRLRIGNC